MDLDLRPNSNYLEFLRSHWLSQRCITQQDAALLSGNPYRLPNDFPNEQATLAVPFLNGLYRVNHQDAGDSRGGCRRVTPGSCILKQANDASEDSRQDYQGLA